MSKRVLHIIDTTGPGGAETVFLNLCEFSAANYEKTLAVVRGSGWVMSQLDNMGIDYKEIDCKGSFNITYLRKLVLLIREEKITLIQTHLFGSAVYGAIAGLITRVPVVSAIHGVVDISSRERFLNAKLFFLRLAKSSLIGVTEQITNNLKNFALIKNDRVHTFYNGVDTNVFQFIASKVQNRATKASSVEIRIGCLGNIREPKNYPLAIRTIKSLSEMGVKARLLIAGQGNEKQLAPLFRLVNQYQLHDQIDFLGFVEDTPAYLASLDVFLMTSSSEGHPLALTQAMSIGVPIVTTPSGVEQIVNHGKDALVSVDHDADQLSELIVEISNNKDLKCRIVNNAQFLVEAKFSTDAMIKRYEQLYSILLA